MRTEENADRWRARVGLSAFVSAAVFLVPVLVAIAASVEFVRIVPAPRSGSGLLAWWVLVLAVPGVVYAVTNRLGRRALPLAALLKMTLVFPDKAPSRMAVARRAGSTRGLERQLAASRDSGLQDEPAVAAEQILALAASLNKHDRLTRGHSERVRVVTDLVAEQLKLPEADRDRLRWSALLHDIGKLTVDGSILNKPGKPDETEWRILQGHPLEGARLAAPLASWLGPWADTIAQHHEKYDGTGYPYGLSGDQISLGGRIVAVADCYETMTAVRSYKAAMTPEAARRELAACAGGHFDPVIVRAFLEASVGSLNLLGGPLSWLGEIPLINGIPHLGQLANTAGQAVAGALAIAGVSVAAVHGAHHAPPAHPTPVVAVGQRSVGPTKVAAGATSPTPVGTTPSLPLPSSHNSAGTADSAHPPSQPVTPPTTIPPLAANPPLAADPLPPSPPITPATVPSAPLSVNGVAGDGQVVLSWTPPTQDGGDPITAYSVTPYIGFNAQPVTTFTSPLSTETITGLSDGTAYTFKVTAITDAGAGPASAASAPITPATVPSAPLSVNGVAGDGQVVLSWTPPTQDGGDPITAYSVTPYIGFNAQPVTTFTSPLSTETITGLSDGTAYTFKVTAITDAGAGPASAASAPITPATVPSAPLSVNGVAGDGQVVLSWTPPTQDGGDPITAYSVTPYIGFNAQPVTTFTSPLSTETITGLSDGTAYTFKVTAITDAGAGPASAASAPITPATVPSAPLSVNGVAGDGQVVLSWTPPTQDGGDPITAYSVTPYIGFNAQPVTTFTSPLSTETITGLSDGTAYTFKVTAITDAGAGPASAASAPITPATVPSAPLSVNGVAGDGQVVLSWTPPTQDGGDPITAYSVTPYIGFNAQPVTTFTSPLSTETITGLSDGTAYTFKVTAITDAGAGPASAASAPITPATVPSAPLSVNGVAGDGQVVLSWTPPTQDGGDPITAYSVTPYIGFNAQPVTTFTSPLSTETITGLSDGTAYTFKVTAITDAGAGPASAASAPITPEPPAPNPPTGLTANPQCQLIVVGPEVTLSWTASTSSSVTSYTILRGATAGGLSSVTSVSSATTSYTDTSVTGLSTTYWYEVEAVGPGGTADSNEVSTTTPVLCL